MGSSCERRGGWTGERRRRRRRIAAAAAARRVFGSPARRRRRGRRAHPRSTEGFGFSTTPARRDVRCGGSGRWGHGGLGSCGVLGVDIGHLEGVFKHLNTRRGTWRSLGAHFRSPRSSACDRARACLDIAMVDARALGRALALRQHRSGGIRVLHRRQRLPHRVAPVHRALGRLARHARLLPHVHRLRHPARAELGGAGAPVDGVPVPHRRHPDGRDVRAGGLDGAELRGARALRLQPPAPAALLRRGGRAAGPAGAHVLRVPGHSDPR
mmetsp:Transcript_33192/g.81569  ORF Transcript_33192/g.81569 Transcript_33192/m.81569 type:complete len:269 (+) Transcript_33192:155-961(+)